MHQTITPPSANRPPSPSEFVDRFRQVMCELQERDAPQGGYAPQPAASAGAREEVAIRNDLRR